MWPSLWMSGAMGVAVLFSGVFLQNIPELHMVILIVQILCGIAVYLGFMMYNQKMLMVEIKNMVISRGVAVAKE